MSAVVSQIEVSVLSSLEGVTVEVRDRRADTITLFAELGEAQRTQLAHDAWAIGLRALGSAHAQAQESRLRDVGAALIGDIDRQLRAHVQAQQHTIAETLARYFDPKDGQVAQRLSAFLDDQGTLARQLEKYLAPQNSVLAETLARQVGDASPLFRKLSPTESEGIVKVLETQLRTVMHSGHSELLRALDPLAEDSALSRLLRSLRDEIKGAEEDRGKQLSSALAALNANDENSLISRLVRETNRARQDLLSAVNPDTPASPMAILKTSLTALLEKHATSHAEVVRQQQSRQEQFEKEVREALTRIDAKRTHDQTSPRGGLVFEDAVIDFVQAATRGSPCLLEQTGNTTGDVERCKKGDAVLRFTDESVFAGCGVVFEAKHESAYSLQRALDELDAARKNRTAAAGVFVMAKSHASEAFPRFARHGNNVLVIWDDHDPTTDPYLHAAIFLGMALVARSKTLGDEGDIKALQDVEHRITKELDRLEKMEKYNENIRKNSDGVADEIRKAQKYLDVLLRKAKSMLKALNVDLSDETAERESPISVTSDSLDASRLVLSRDR